MTWVGSIAPAGVVTLSVLVAMETFVKVFVPKNHPPAAAIAAIVCGLPHKIVAKLSDDSNIVANARRNDLFKIASPRIICTPPQFLSVLSL